MTFSRWLIKRHPVRLMTGNHGGQSPRSHLSPRASPETPCSPLFPRSKPPPPHARAPRRAVARCLPRAARFLLHLPSVALHAAASATALPPLHLAARHRLPHRQVLVVPRHGDEGTAWRRRVGFVLIEVQEAQSNSAVGAITNPSLCCFSWDILYIEFPCRCRA
jgi:hypothetical protein